jgi:hypothetical protein
MIVVTSVSISFFLVNLVCCGVTNSFFTVAMTSVSSSFFQSTWFVADVVNQRLIVA